NLNFSIIMNIEDLIKHRKSELDIETPPPELWNNIQKEWKSEKRTFQWWKMVAVISITLTIGLLINNWTLQKKVDELASLGDISEKYKKVEDDYISQINQIESSLPIKEIRSKKAYKWITEELNTLEQVNLIYRKDIGSISEDQLVNVLIDYYEKKIRLLKKLELEIKRANKFKEHEENTTDNIRL
ncbi:MAG: hypothetical protein AAFY41_03025, partial [Bacteroidota bacterium]